MQCQRPGGNPPFVGKVLVSDRAYACEVISRVRKTHVKNHVIYVRTPCQHSNQWANTLVTAGFLPFSRKYISDLFVIFMPVLPKNMSSITI